ncbi:MAG: ferritin-like domain-containing protein [Myxococcaceae bacterium]|nr:ferritin-like domain-containing protein [Myxococcaceae bacterium]
MSALSLTSPGDCALTQEYGGGLDALQALYQKGKRQQWDAERRIDWSQAIDFERPLTRAGEVGRSPAVLAFQRLAPRAQAEYRRALLGWNLSQFLHGEQGAMICASKLVQVVPDHATKLFAATQVIDEARHVEVFARLLAEQVGHLSPIDPSVKKLLAMALASRHWDFVFLGVQVVIESLAMASFSIYRDLYVSPLLKAACAYVMEDEARHIAFGRLTLRSLYAELSEPERSEREDFLLETCRLMEGRLYEQNEVHRRFGLPELDATSPEARLFHRTLFVRLVPTVRDIGLWSNKVRSAFEQLGVVKYASLDVTALSEADSRRAQEHDRV